MIAVMNENIDMSIILAKYEINITNENGLNAVN